MAAVTHEHTRYSKDETDRYADAYKHRIHYNDVGSGPVLFCFHGGGPGSNAWDNTKHNLDDLAENFRCIIMDMPGYGLSDKEVKRGDEPLDIFCARVILGLMDHLGIDKAHLYGSSQFSAACMRFGIEYPDRVGRIIIQASGVGGRPYFTPGQTYGGQLLGVTAANPTRENMAKLMHEFIPRDEWCTDEMIDTRLESALIPGHLAARSKMLERMGIPGVEWLIHDTMGRPYSCDRWNCVRYKVFRQAGIQGDFRILRPSFAMKLKDIGMVLDDRSRLLRHTSTETTAKFYSNMESLEPWARVEERLAKNRLIS